MLKKICDQCEKETKDEFMIHFTFPTGQTYPGPFGPKEEVWRKDFNLCRPYFAGFYSMVNKIQEKSNPLT